MSASCVTKVQEAEDTKSCPVMKLGVCSHRHTKDCTLGECSDPADWCVLYQATSRQATLHTSAYTSNGTRARGLQPLLTP